MLFVSWCRDDDRSSDRDNHRNNTYYDRRNNAYHHNSRALQILVHKQSEKLGEEM